MWSFAPKWHTAFLFCPKKITDLSKWDAPLQNKTRQHGAAGKGSKQAVGGEEKKSQAIGDDDMRPRGATYQAMIERTATRLRRVPSMALWPFTPPPPLCLFFLFIFLQSFWQAYLVFFWRRVLQNVVHQRGQQLGDSRDAGCKRSIWCWSVHILMVLFGLI